MNTDVFRGRQERRTTIRDRRTGTVLLQLPTTEDSLRGVYLGHRIAKDIRSADLRAKDLSEADLTGRDLSDADLTGAVFASAQYDALTRWPNGFDPERHGAVRVPVDLKGAKLEEETDLLSGVDLTDADLRGASLKGANLRGVNLTRAKLLGADLSGADMAGATLAGADLRHVRHDEATVWPEGFDPGRRLSGDDAVGTVPGLEQTVSLLKGLADLSRLRVLGLLAQEEHTVEELATALTLTEPTVSHHLSRLKTLGLVTMQEEGTRHRYRVDADALRAALTSLPETLIESAKGDVDSRTFERKIETNYFDEGGRLKHIPMRSLKKLHVVLRRLVEEFTLGERYPEKEVNTRLGRFHEDFATLRRHLVDFRYMAREGGIYWRLPRE